MLNFLTVLLAFICQQEFQQLWHAVLAVSVLELELVFECTLSIALYQLFLSESIIINEVIKLTVYLVLENFSRVAFLYFSLVNLLHMFEKIIWLLNLILLKFI